MINFSTEFPIAANNSVEDVVRAAWEWVVGSPHTKIAKGALAEISADSEWSHTTGEEQVSVATASVPQHSIGGLRYVRREHGLEWTTSIVGLKTSTSHLLSIQVSCITLGTAVLLPTPKKPYFVRQALTKLGGGMDGQIPVADRPFRLDEGEAPIAAALMSGTAANRLPIVYVSAGFDGSYSIDPDEMARFVSGMAHVVVEPSRTFSHSLRILTNARNVYGGTVGVYWPESSARKSYFFSVGESRNARALQVEVAKDIRVALCNRRSITNCTWANLTETLASKRYELLKARGSTELQQYIDAFDGDLAAKAEKLQDAEREFARLNAEVRRLTSASQVAAYGLLLPGNEQDLYENESKDIVIDSLEQALRTVKHNSRRQHVLTSILANNKSSGAKNRIEDELKALLKTYREMDARTRSALARLGFDISDDGKHHKAVYHGDGRYTFIFPKSGSDHRGGRNLASDIVSTLF